MTINLSDFNELPTKGHLYEVQRNLEKRLDHLDKKTDRVIDLIKSLMGEEPVSTKEFLSPKEVSQILGVHSSTVRNWVKDPYHNLKGIQPDGKTCTILIQRVDLENYLGKSLESIFYGNREEEY